MKRFWTNSKGGCIFILAVTAWLFCAAVINFFSFLHYASMDGYLPVVVVMTLLGGSPVAWSGDKVLEGTPFHYAAEHGHTNVVKYYLKIGADPNVLARRGYTPLDFAEYLGQSNMEELLREYLDQDSP